EVAKKSYIDTIYYATLRYIVLRYIILHSVVVYMIIPETAGSGGAESTRGMAAQLGRGRGSVASAHVACVATMGEGGVGVLCVLP
ncbi:uncharacterized protein SCHCODRAFT_02146319, partial [Schizophyllum commune H4-8]|uniref:uncharacterized protein n=1 Tax=Schizophyllum commune (strain H4-8 / FGSC 9210) TaxID=578458 RepID=UPI00215FBE12